jgi:cobalt-zinc-cadmium efflux system protein
VSKTSDGRGHGHRGEGERSGHDHGHGRGRGREGAGEAHDHDHDHAHDHAHDHPHDHPLDSRDGSAHAPSAHALDARSASKLPWVLALTTSFFVIELTAAAYAKSNALRADAIHLLADILAIAIAYTAFRVADRRPSARFTFGLRRIEAVAALVNSILVLLGAAEIVHEGIEALSATSAPRTGIMLGVAGAALVVHGLNATLLHRDLHGHGHAHSPHVHALGRDHDAHAGLAHGAHGGAHSHLHVRGAWLHVMGDALGALCALVAGAAIRFGASPKIDSIASFLVALLLVVGAIRLVRDAVLVLLEAAPKHLPIPEIEAAVVAVAGVECVHRLRVWSLGTGYDAIALHVMAKEGGDLALAAAVERTLRSRFHLDYVCVQVDPPGAHP